MKVVELSGGVGGARMARGLAAADDVDLTVAVNVGDDSDNHGLVVCPDLDTVIYTLAGMEGPQGWGRAGDSFVFNEEIARFGVDNTFRLGDKDLALKLFRTQMLDRAPLSEVTSAICRAFDLDTKVVPATDDRLRTRVRVDDGWISFQEYFVDRRYRDTVHELEFQGSAEAAPTPGLLEAIADADVVVIAPSNPPLSIWPILSIPGLRDSVVAHPRVVAVSPLIGGRPVKGPADDVMVSLGLPPGNDGVAAAYEGLLARLVIDESDRATAPVSTDLEVLVTQTLIPTREDGARLAKEILSW